MACTATFGADPTTMGIGPIGNSDVVFKRKFRWLFTIYTSCDNGSPGIATVPASVVKLAARPNLTIEETEINFLNAKTWIPGKGSWETITVTYYDVGGASLGPTMGALYSWLATVYDFTDSVCLRQSSTRAGYAGEGILNLYDGCGNMMEQWTLNNMWPQAVNFGELDYSSSEEVTIELTLRFSEVTYQSFCPNGNVQPCCTGCK